MILYPKTRSDLLRIIKVASKHKIALVPVSSEWDFHGSTVTDGGAIIDLRDLNRIEKVRPTFDGMSIDIEPGVTFQQANEHLRSQGYRLLVPLRQPPQASVVSTHYGKNPVLEANKYGYHQDWMILTYQMAIAKGIFVGFGSEGLETVGEPGDYPYSPRADLGRMFLGGLGSFGIVSRATVKLKYNPPKYDYLFATGENLSDLLKKLRDVTLHTDAGQTVLIADPKILASYLAKSRTELEDYWNKLPTWTAIIAIAGTDEYIQTEKLDLIDEAASNSLKLDENIMNLDISKILGPEFRLTDNIGSNFDLAPHIRIEFYTTLGRLGKIRAAANDLFKLHKIEEEKIGFMSNSIEMGRSYFCEYDIYYDGGSQKMDPDSLPNVGNVNLRELYEKVYKTIIEAGGVINMPRNPIIADLIYPRIPNYYEMMRVLKYCLDPKNIMHPRAVFAGRGGIEPKTVQITREVV